MIYGILALLDLIIVVYFYKKAKPIGEDDEF